MLFNAGFISYIAATSAPVYGFLTYFYYYYAQYCVLLSHITSFETMVSGAREVNPVTLTIPSGSVVKCLTRIQVLWGRGFEPYLILWVFHGVSLGKTLQSPSLVLVKTRKDMNNVSSRRIMTELLLKAA